MEPERPEEEAEAESLQGRSNDAGIRRAGGLEETGGNRGERPVGSKEDDTDGHAEEEGEVGDTLPTVLAIDQGRANAEVAQDVEQANYEEGHAHHQPDSGRRQKGVTNKGCHEEQPFAEQKRCIVPGCAGSGLADQELDSIGSITERGRISVTQVSYVV